MDKHSWTYIILSFSAGILSAFALIIIYFSLFSPPMLQQQGEKLSKKSAETSDGTESLLSDIAGLREESARLTKDLNYIRFVHATEHDGVGGVVQDEANTHLLYIIAMRNENGSIRATPHSDDGNAYVASIRSYDVRSPGTVWENTKILYSQTIPNNAEIRLALSPSRATNDQIIFFVTDFEDTPGHCAQAFLTSYSFFAIDTTTENQEAVPYLPSAEQMEEARLQEARCLNEGSPR